MVRICWQCPFEILGEVSGVNEYQMIGFFSLTRISHKQPLILVELDPLYGQLTGNKPDVSALVGLIPVHP